MPSAPAAYISNLWPLSSLHLVVSNSHKKGTQEREADLHFLNKETERPLGWSEQQRKQRVEMGEPENHTEG